MDLDTMSDVFSAFHDGGIIGFEEKWGVLRLVIQCDYLAEMIQPEFQFFYLDLYDVEKFELDPWTSDESIKIFAGPQRALQADLEIGSADVKDGHIVVYCHQRDDDYDYVGGTLKIKCSGIRIYDHLQEEMTVEDLRIIFNAYWNKFR